MVIHAIEAEREGRTGLRARGRGEGEAEKRSEQPGGEVSFHGECQVRWLNGDVVFCCGSGGRSHAGQREPMAMN